jgi:hypothetical protein
VLAADAYLFQPADAINVVQGGDDGTPMQKDEPQAENPPEGAAIDYYLRTNASGPVTIEILDPAGKVLHTFSSEKASVAPRGRRGRPGGIPNTTALWRPEPKPLDATAGMHRVTWLPVDESERGRGGFGEGFGRRLTFITGTFTAKLTVNGTSYTRSFTVLPDPRSTGS